MPQTHYIRFVPSPAVIKRIGQIHTQLYRLSLGLIGRRVDGLDILLLTTTGKRSGRPRTVPLPYFCVGSQRLLVASFGGNAEHPAWYRNLEAKPKVTVQLGSVKQSRSARITAGEERARLWAQITHDFPRYAEYQKRTTRLIPVVVLAASGDS
jgi:deazaflavin-dependent oxidoreductase (nitroreductase family)